MAKIKITRLLAVFAATIFAAFASVAFAAPSGQFRDWTVTCEADLTCQAFTISQEAGIWAFGIERGPEANAPIIFFVRTDLGIKAGDPILLAVASDKGDVDFEVPNPQLREANSYQSDEVPFDSKIITAMVQGEELLLNIATREDFSEIVLSLSGSSAAFRFMDEAQGRLEKQDALMVRGSGEATAAVSREKRIESDANLPADVLSLWQSKSTGCEAEGADLTKQYGGTEVSLDEGATLYILPCGLPGAYNLVTAVFLSDSENGQVRQVMLPSMGERGPIVMDTVFNTAWNDKTNQLTGFYKGRGLGDCGEAHIWALTGQDYYSGFELIEQRSKDDCDGKNDDWPKVWPIK